MVSNTSSIFSLPPTTKPLIYILGFLLTIYTFSSLYSPSSSSSSPPPYSNHKPSRFTTGPSSSKTPPPPGEGRDAGDDLTVSRHDTFTIAIFSDLHFGEEESSWGIDQDINSRRVMRQVLRHELGTKHGLQLAVLNGDLVTGENTFRENSSEYVDQVVEPLEEVGLPWASVYGNHDSKFNLSRRALFEREITHPLSLTKRMVVGLEDEDEDEHIQPPNQDPPDLTTTVGLTNYYILIRPSPSPSHQSLPTPPPPILILWFFDSRGGSVYQNSQSIDHDDIPNHVSPIVASWYHRTRQRLNQQYNPDPTQSIIPSLAFVHIPPHVYLTAQSSSSFDRGHYPGLNADVPLVHQGTSLGGEDGDFISELLLAAGPEPFEQQAIPLSSLSSSSSPTSRYYSSYSGGGLRAVFVGHDHGDSWCSLWPGRAAGSSAPFLCFARHSGYGGYGTWDRGARVVRVSWPQQDEEDEEDEEGKGEEEEGEEGEEDIIPMNKYREMIRRRRRMMKIKGGEPRRRRIEVETWVRMENGDVIDRVSLNETYGLDVYPQAGEASSK